MEVKFKDRSKTDDCCEIKIADPRALFRAMRETSSTGVVMLDMLSWLEQSGWTIYASVDQHFSLDEVRGSDTWYCCRPVG